MGLFSSSETENTTNLDVDDFSNQVANRNQLDARGGQIIDVSGVSGRVDIQTSDFGAVRGALELASRSLDRVTGVAELATDQASVADDALDNFVLFGGIALVAVGVIVFAGGK